MQNFSQSFELFSVGSQNFIPQQNAFTGKRGLPLKETFHESGIIRINDGGKSNQVIEFHPIINSVHQITQNTNQNVLHRNKSQSNEPINTTVLTASFKVKEKKKRVRNKQSQLLSSQRNRKKSKCTQRNNKYMPEIMDQIGEEQCSVDEDEDETDQVY